MMEGVVARRHRDRGEGSRQADRRQDLVPPPMRQGRLVHRFLSRHRGRHLSRILTSRGRSGGANAATGGHLAAPIARDFLKLALADKPAIPFKVPAGIKLIRVDAKSGMRVGPGEGGRTILEAFKPGTRAAG